jgi:deazaflavin-dependent oxidoreductase (nitroreductase family)
MPIPRSVARLQRRFVHPVVRRLAGVLPGYGLLVHTGRKSGRVYRTPLNVFAVPGGFAIVLAYGQHTDWLRNVQAAGGGEVIKRRRRYAISNLRIVSGPQARAALPFYGRLAGRVTKSPDILLVDATQA